MANGMEVDTDDELKGGDFWLRGLFGGGAKQSSDHPDV